MDTNRDRHEEGKLQRVKEITKGKPGELRQTNLTIEDVKRIDKKNLTFITRAIYNSNRKLRTH